MITKVIDSVFSIDTFELQYIVLKCVLQSPRLKDPMKTIGIDQYLSKNSLSEHKYF